MARFRRNFYVNVQEAACVEADGADQKSPSWGPPDLVPATTGVANLPLHAGIPNLGAWSSKAYRPPDSVARSTRLSTTGLAMIAPSGRSDGRRSRRWRCRGIARPADRRRHLSPMASRAPDPVSASAVTVWPAVGVRANNCCRGT
jgi:hypothetical protein